MTRLLRVTLQYLSFSLILLNEAFVLAPFLFTVAAPFTAGAGGGLTESLRDCGWNLLTSGPSPWLS